MLSIAQFEVLTLNEWIILMQWAKDNGVSLPVMESLVECDRSGDNRLLFLLLDELTKVLVTERSIHDDKVRIIADEVAQELREEMSERRMDPLAKSDALTVDEARTLLGPMIGADYKTVDEIDNVFVVINRIIARVPDKDHKAELMSSIETLSMLRSALKISQKS